MGGKKPTRSSKPSPPRGPWLTVKQAAEYLAMKERAVRELESRGILPGQRFENNVRFSLPELDEHLHRNRQPSANEMHPDFKKQEVATGPLMTPEAAAEYTGLPSGESIVKRAQRMQVPVYRVSIRIIRFRAVELDSAMSEKSLTNGSSAPIVEDDACLPESRRR